MDATASADGVVVSSRSRAADRRSWPNEVALSVILFAVAFAVRLPYLMRVPGFWTEGVEVLHALRIADGKILPLTGAVPYQGPFFFYLVAGLIRLFGPHIEIARLVALVGGCFLVVATYWLGRTLWNRSAGLMAACLILTSPQMVIETSHYGWTLSLTPLFVSLTLLATYCGIVASVTWPLVLGGVLGALAVQTHPTSALAIGGLCAWVLCLGDIGARLRRRGPWLAAGALALIYAPMIAANLRRLNKLGTLAEKRQYVVAPVTSLSEYVARVFHTMTTVMQGLWDGWLAPGPAATLFQMLIAAFVLAGLALALRRQARVIVFIMASGVFLQPLIVRQAAFRYLAYLIPIAAVAVAIAADALGDWLRRRRSARWALVGWVVPLVIMSVSLYTITSYYSRALSVGDSNDGLLRVRDQILRDACGPGLLIDRINDDSRTFAHGRVSFNLQAMDYVLTMARCEHVVSPSDQTPDRLEVPGAVQWLFTWRDRAQLPPDVLLEPVASMVPPPVAGPPLRLTLFRVRRGR